MRERTCVLVAAGGATWETTALPALSDAGVVVLKRCVDLIDLLATASAGQADIALVAADLPGLDTDAVAHLLRHDVRTVAVSAPSGDAPAASRLAGLGVVETVDPEDLPSMLEAVSRVAAEDPEGLLADPDPAGSDLLPMPGDTSGRILAVWGPTGAPGRTTIAVGLAAERASTGQPVVLVDADGYGGTVAQHLGVLDEVSGILAAARLANAGALDAESFATCRRRVANGFDVLTGLPRADRWIEVRTGVLEQVLALAARVGDVVVDCGFCLEDELGPGRHAGRNQMTLDALAGADEVVVVGSADPTGLTRLARSLVELAEVSAGPVRVVVNRMRASLGWSERDITGMVEGYVRPLGVHFVAEDRATLDRALVSGKSLVELGDSPLRQSVAALGRCVFGAAQAHAAHP